MTDDSSHLRIDTTTHSLHQSSGATIRRNVAATSSPVVSPNSEKESPFLYDSAAHSPITSPRSSNGDTRPAHYTDTAAMNGNGDHNYASVPRSPMSPTRVRSKGNGRFLSRYPCARFLVLGFVAFSILYFGIHSLGTLVGFNSPLHSSADLNRQFDTHHISPLSNMTMQYRFSKMNSKLPGHVHERMEPFFIAAERAADVNQVTAGLFFHERTIDDIVSISQRWDGPISAVLHLQDPSPNFQSTLAKLAALREANQHIRQNVDVHLIISPPHTKKAPTSKAGLPKMSNFHQNTVRFFARTNYIALLDSQTFPSFNLHATIKKNWKHLLDQDDVLVIPTFLFTDNGKPPTQDTWPDSKESMIKSVESGEMALWDKAWEWNKGPSCWDLWRRARNSAIPAGGKEIAQTGGQQVYKVDEYELHFTGNVVFKRDSQPWCTERFVDNKAACIYQMYLTGAELWVLPDAFLISTEKDTPPPAAEKFERSIATRLYTKFHQEICMHYAREFYHQGELDSRRAKHLKFLCARVLHSWGKGIVTV